jgi:hypothetical protein
MTADWSSGRRMNIEARDRALLRNQRFVIGALLRRSGAGGAFPAS